MVGSVGAVRSSTQNGMELIVNGQSRPGISTRVKILGVFDAITSEMIWCQVSEPPMG
jgi:hypothetical protein